MGNLGSGAGYADSRTGHVPAGSGVLRPASVEDGVGVLISDILMPEITKRSWRAMHNVFEIHAELLRNGKSRHNIRAE